MPQLIPNALFHFTRLSQWDHIWFHFLVCSHKPVAGKYLSKIFMREEYYFIMGERSWFDSDIVHIVIFIEIRFLMLKLVISCLKKTL